MTNEREPHDPSRFDEDDDGAEIGSDAADSTDSALPGTFSPRRARREQVDTDSAPRTLPAGPASSSSAPLDTSQTRPASEAGFAWGLTPRVPGSNDRAVGRSTARADDAASSVEPGTPTENDRSPAPSRLFYPPPPVRSSDFDAPAPRGVVTPVEPKPVAPNRVVAEPAVAEPAVAEPAPVGSSPLPSPLPIPTIEQVLDAPSPRRAAREAAAREEAARAARTPQPPPPAPMDTNSGAPQTDAGVPPLTEPVVANGRVRAPEIEPDAPDLSAAYPGATGPRATERNTTGDASAWSTPSSEAPGPSLQPADTTADSGLDALFGNQDGGAGSTMNAAVGAGSEASADGVSGRRFDQAESEPGDPKPRMGTRQKVLIGVVILLLIVLVVVVLLAVGRMSATTAALIPTFGWAASMGLPPV